MRSLRAFPALRLPDDVADETGLYHYIRGIMFYNTIVPLASLHTVCFVDLIARLSKSGAGSQEHLSVGLTASVSTHPNEIFPDLY